MELGLGIFCVEYILSWPCGQNHYYYYYYNRAKQTKAFKRAPLKPIIYSHFGQAISIDHTECSKKPTPRGNIALLVITDIFTSYIVCVPIKSITDFLKIVSPVIVSIFWS